MTGDQPAPPDNNDARILLIDDDPGMLESLSGLLKLYGYEVDTALGGQTALEKLSSDQYDVILLDLRMPNVSGHDVMSFIRQNDIDTVVIVVSGETSINDVSKALRHGAYDYIKKPYVPEELTATVNNAVRKKLLEKTNRIMQARLNRSEKLHRFIVNSSPDIIFILDDKGHISFINEKAEELLSCQRNKLMGQHITNLIEDNVDKATYFFERALSPHSGPQTMDLALKAPSNISGSRHFEVSLWPIDEAGNSKRFHVYATARDISERMEAEAFINFQAYHDLLTRLPNRSLFKDRLSNSINQAERNHGQLAVMFIDLDRFKIINDSFGHNMGDRLLQAVSQRLQQHVRKSDTLSRFGGDEFTLLLSEINSSAAATQVAEKILESIKQPFSLGGHDIHVGASIGIALYPESATTMDELIKNSDLAMYRVKKTGKDGYQIYSPEMSNNSTERLLLEQDMRKAIPNNEFEICYQPQVDTASQKIVGVEALIRWNHPTLGRLLPEEFIPIAEDSRLIADIDKHTLTKACREIRLQHKNGMPNLRLAVNLSPLLIEHNDFVKHVLETLEKEQFPASLLELEITENILMADRQDIVEKLMLLSAKGVNIAIDDFGTGYSSLSYLQKFPINTLKIDRSFINNIKHGEGEACIVNAIIAMAQGLKMSIVAEGVENKTQLEYLQTLNCNIVQGYLFGMASSLEAVINQFNRDLTLIKSVKVA